MCELWVSVFSVFVLGELNVFDLLFTGRTRELPNSFQVRVGTNPHGGFIPVQQD